jgi:hypothetical protein
MDLSGPGIDVKLKEKKRKEDIYHRWTIRNNLRLWRHDFLLVMFVDASKI